uniref:G-protein coupled receptors family 1 profile domain-containing protein n=1 Tax=Romanomermis culicivorax TaxID=13658 RepID=A0A915JYB6_ROMCU
MENATASTYPSPYLLLPTIFLLSFSSVGISAYYFLFKLIVQNSECMPNDVKFLITNLSCSFCLRALYMVYKFVYELLIFNYGFETFSVTFTYCAIEQSFYMVTGLCRNATFLIISLNRLWKTVSKPSVFSHTANERSACSMTFILILSTWLPSYFLYSMVVIASTQTLDTNVHIRFCYLTSIFESHLSNVQNYVMLFMQFSTTAVYIVVYVINKSKLREFKVGVMENSLNGRYVQWANVKVSRWLMPLTLFSALLSAATISSAIIVRLTAKLSQIQSINMSMILIMIYGADAALYPFMCIW